MTNDTGSAEDKVFDLDKATDRLEGTVKWFDATKGYGFLLTDSIDEEVFVHHTEIEAEGYRKLADGASVSFVVAKTDNGYAAKSVRALQEVKAVEANKTPEEALD